MSDESERGSFRRIITHHFSLINLLRGLFDLVGPFDKTGRLTGAVAEVVQLRAADFAVALHFHLGELRGVDRKRPLDSFAGDDSADREVLVHAGAATGDDDAVENLDTLFVAFQNSLMDINGIANFKSDRLFTETRLFSGEDEFVTHGKGSIRAVPLWMRLSFCIGLVVGGWQWVGDAKSFRTLTDLLPTTNNQRPQSVGQSSCQGTFAAGGFFVNSSADVVVCGLHFARDAIGQSPDGCR